ncbi:carboxylesterase family protein [Lutibacter sp. Hel_I_33_5]|uniref:prolyl oligopeptidase family serine peptidase n=1 Tax=Lutibacter sp. Hel_I_33_5 TaxID=1566289 RepID=UPI0011ABEB4A|nr:prolyl oligopeptidase family serine peptidase [Lutibacter sp. Hel_I_33_5]TVZ55450.1 carboxylesterase family protein [Lutibacter sp. Hel_I_33_5]
MNFKFTKIVSLSFLFLFLSCTTEDGIVKEISSAQFINKTYGSEKNQNYDIYLPKGRTANTPVIVLIHGGFWSQGDKSDMTTFVNLFLNNSSEYAIVNTNYRLAGATGNQHPAQINDISSLISELKSKQDEYIISRKYYFIGYSAGGHLALLYSYFTDTAKNVKAVCSLAGPTDFLDPAFTNSPNGAFQNIALNFLGLPLSGNESLYKNTSPISHIDEKSAPTLLLHGENDQLVFLSQSQRLLDKLNTFNVANQHTFYPNQGHDLSTIDLNEATNKIKTFFDLYK